MESNSPSMRSNDVKDTEAGLVPVKEDAARSRNQPPSAPNQPPQPLKVEPNFRDSSGPLFSMYSKAAEEEDNKMAERWQKDANGILIFTGLFSVAVAALLAVTIQKMIPNSQDTSAFYLGNIYQLLADQNATLTPIPSPVAIPHPFSPPIYVIWVNALWFLSLVVGVTCALLATSSQQWARRYIKVTQPARCSPEKRARMRAFFANGMEKMHITWAVEGLPALLHLSVFLFFAGLVIFLFNINHVVFSSAAWWIGLFTITYGLITVMPILWHDSPYFSPLSPLAWFLYSSISYLFFRILFFVKSDGIIVYKNWQYLRDSRDRYRGWILGGVEKAAEETVSKRISDIDAEILRWTIDDVGDDDGMANFFEAIPRFFNSKMVNGLKRRLPDTLRNRFWRASHGFFERTLSSNSVIESIKSNRLDIGMSAMSTITTSDISSIPKDILFETWDQLPQDIESGRTLANWCINENKAIAQYAQCIATRILTNVQERDDRWIEIATRVLGLLEGDVRHYIAHGNDSVSLAMLISVARQYIRSDFYDWGVMLTLFKLDIRKTLPELQHDFCTLWNECVQKAAVQGPDTFPIGVLRLTRFLYIRLHQGTNAAPTRFSALTPDFDHVLFLPESYPSCGIYNHQPGLTSPDSRAETGESSQAHSTSSPASPGNPIAHSVGGSRSGGVAATPQDATLAATSFYPLGGNKQEDIVTSWVITDTGRISLTASTSSLTLASAAPILNKPSASHDAGSPSTSKHSLPASSIIPAPPSSLILPMPNSELLSLGCNSPSSPLDNDKLKRFRARGLINEGDMCFANATLQLLVYCPPFLDHMRDVGRLIGQHGQGGDQQTDGRTTLLMDATIRLLNEFLYKEKPLLTQQSLQLAHNKKAREDERRNEADDTNSFLPTYVYDAMKEKRQFKHMLDGRQQDAEEFFCAYLDALDEELLVLLDSISTHRTALKVEEVKESQTEVEKRNYIVSAVQSPSYIFDGKFRTTVCTAGHPDIVTVESRRSLQLDIQPDSVHTIQDALAHISRSRFAQVGPGPSTGKASQQVKVLIEALPPVLVIHLKRFSYDVTSGGVVKSSKPVQLSPELEIPPDIMAPGAGQSVVPARYTLYGVLYHHGSSASGGHYTVDVLDPNTHGGCKEAWLHIDDEIVSTVQQEDVFGRHDSERTDDRCAYLLFYRRSASTQT